MSDFMLIVKDCCGEDHTLHALQNGYPFYKNKWHDNLHTDITVLGLYPDADVSNCAIVAYAVTQKWSHVDEGYPLWHPFSYYLFVGRVVIDVEQDRYGNLQAEVSRMR